MYSWKTKKWKQNVHMIIYENSIISFLKTKEHVDIASISDVIENTISILQ